MASFYFELRLKPGTKRKYYYQEVPEPTAKSIEIDDCDFNYDDDGNVVDTWLCYTTWNGKIIEDWGKPRHFHITQLGEYDEDIVDELLTKGVSKDKVSTLRLYFPEVKRL